jgi:hypothetical protein
MLWSICVIAIVCTGAIAPCGRHDLSVGTNGRHAGTVANYYEHSAADRVIPS